MPRLSLRAKLVVGVLLVLVPLLGVGAWSLASAYESRRTVVELDLLQTAQVAGVLVDRSLESWVTFAGLLSRDEEVVLLDPARAREEFRRISAVTTGVLNLALADLEGNIIASARGQGEGPVNVGDRAYFKAVLASGEPVLSNVLEGRMIGRPGIIAAAPVGLPGEDPRAVVMVSVRLEELQRQLEDIDLREGQRLFLLDPVGRLAFKNPDEPLQWREETLESDPLLSRALAGESVFEAEAQLFGEPPRVAAAVVPTEEMRWVVGVTLSNQLAFQTLNRAWRFQALAFGLIALLSITAAVLGAALLSRRIRHLGSHARELAGGNLEARIAAKPGGDDLDVLAHEFNHMAHSLREERRQRELFLSAIVHDLRNLIAPISLHAGLLDRVEHVTPERLEKLKEKLTIQVRRLDRLVSDLLDLSRIEAGHFQLQKGRVDLDQLVRRAAEEQPPEVRERLIIESDGPLQLNADADRLTQVLTNLLSNAVKYSPQGGSIWLRVLHTGPLARIEVEDQGLGLDASEVSRIFSPWERLRPEGQIRGIGLGLFICRTIVEAHGGSIAASSRGQGFGSLFSLELPAEPPPSSR